MAKDASELSKVPKIRMLAEDNVRTGFLEHSEYVSLRQAMPQYLVPLFVVGYHIGFVLENS